MSDNREGNYPVNINIVALIQWNERMLADRKQKLEDLPAGSEEASSLADQIQDLEQKSEARKAYLEANYSKEEIEGMERDAGEHPADFYMDDERFRAATPKKYESYQDHKEANAKAWEVMGAEGVKDVSAHTREYNKAWDAIQAKKEAERLNREGPGSTVRK